MDTPLGKPTRYTDRYDPDLLAPLARTTMRQAMGVGEPLPFVGEDLWHGYEFSWLSPGGMPRVAGLRLRVPATSPRMVESKSVKLYLNGFAQARFATAEAVRDTLAQDLTAACGAAVTVELLPLASLPGLSALPGHSLDTLDMDIDVYERDPALVTVTPAAEPIQETLHTDLFRSLCPVTGQPDWASVVVRYTGPPISHQGLLRYLISYRRHQAFHEATVEQIFLDLKAHCGPSQLLVGGYFLRRGGLDINPLRADSVQDWPLLRLARQ